MEIKKITRVLRMILIILIILVMLPVLLIWENDQFKQVGDTKFYLLPDPIGRESYLYYREGEKSGFYPIGHEGIVHDIYWNHKFVIIKCNQDNAEHRYILRNIIDKYSYRKFRVKHFVAEKDYRLALDSLGLSETDMEHDDGKIPFRINLSC